MGEVNLRVDGMHCDACIRRVTESLQSVAGVELKEVQIGVARVRLTEGAKPDALIAGLSKAGFAVRVEK
jgi:copper chaperone